ncbi:uncharacterized protein [Nicotiana sylvestris]|uniref:Uncharacterized protein LOC104228761 isoform X1 n=1 Tax=Nicotiana sylvestris TaxID=4096 RepID=A0A1U7WQL8_NICSY|nr:PREDICTED: uncharacterized protein LOC104228761 isoform X1 [Nicotiana sylvestris]XP_009779591.1 PREDICTED: uncharacterized protein LOC104228761 isoform X1 [Nicotiana sylvestris]
MASFSRFLYQNLFLSLTTAFASVSTYLSPLFSFITTFFRRLRRGNPSLNKNSGFKEEYQKEADFSEAEQQLDSESEAFKDASEFPDSENNGEVQKTELSFTFRFPTYEEFCKSRGEKGEFLSSKWMPSTCNHKSLTETEVVETEDLKEVHSKSESFNEEEKGNSGNLTCDEEEMQKSEGLNSVKGESNISDEFLFESEKDSLTDSDTVSVGFEHIRYLMNKLVDQYSDGFLTGEDFGGEFEHNEKLSDFEMSEENQESEDSDSDIMEELRKLEHDQAQQFLSEDDFQETVKLRNEDANKLETLWEHQELIEQLKMELRKVRDMGLPTILEESGSLKMEDLQPWKIEEKFQREDCMSELHKFYKSYRERMRKFDILTYQKMYAIGYLQKDPINDPFQHISSQRCSGPKLKSLISQNIRLLKHKRHDNIDPMVKFIKVLQSDLEVIYVAQMCLSWEFLHWQYGKALSLWDSDPRGVRTYNEVAGEFQQFQVLLQRFIENEPFQGPRVQYYIKSRYDLRNLLQVPVIREDRMKDKNKARAGEKADYFITSDMLVEILEESIRIFWQFVRADRNCSNMMVKGQNRKRQELQAPEDLELLMDVKKSLEKKEKKLKHALRGECCILRRFRKHKEEDDSDHVLYFFSQVDMKLVARVLNMSRLTTNQLVWCHNKLKKISFVHRKIHVDPSFLLFPC